MLRCCCNESSEAESGEYLRMVSAATLLAGGRATTIARAAVGGVVRERKWVWMAAEVRVCFAGACVRSRVE